MPIFRRCGRCGMRYETGGSCPRCSAKEIRAERNRQYDQHQRDQDSKRFYNSGDWLRARACALELDDGWDVYAYMTSGMLIPADTVHHIIPLKEDRRKALDPSNLMSVSASSHAAVESLYSINPREAERQLADMLRRYRSGGGVGGCQKV